MEHCKRVCRSEGHASLLTQEVEIFVRGLPRSVKREVLLDWFAPFGEVTEASVRPGLYIVMFIQALATVPARRGKLLTV
eukprot:8164-Heterococcus_DN1.PRE.24